MTMNRPLVNPSPQDFKEAKDKEIDLPLPAIYSKDQIGMELDNSRVRFQQFLSGAKTLINKRKEILEVYGLWKNPALPFAITSMVFLVLVVLLGGLFAFGSLPKRLPFFYDNIAKQWEQSDKSIIFLFPIFLVIWESIIIYFITKIYKYDRRLSLTMCWLMTLINILFLIAVSQIYTLVT